GGTGCGTAHRAAEAGTLDGVDQTAVRGGSSTGGGVLPDSSGKDAVTTNRYWVWSVGVVVLLGLMLPGRAFAQDGQDLGIALGATPPPVTIQDLDGRPVNLAPLIAKKPLLIHFWPTWSP